MGVHISINRMNKYGGQYMVKIYMDNHIEVVI